MQAHDLVVIGGGFAGLAAANRAAQLGLRPMVLEAGGDGQYLCNSRYTGGTFHVSYHDIMAGEQELFDAIRAATDGFVSEDHARAIARDGRRVVRWLQDEGVRFIKASATAYQNWVLAPPGRTRPGLDWEGRSGDVLLRTLEANLERRGARLLRGTRAVGLAPSGAGWRVEAAQAGTTVVFEARAVMIADGGFQSDPELLARHITPRPRDLHQRNARTAVGDGLRMAAALGAGIIGTDRFYGHVLSRDAFTKERLWPYPYLDALVAAGIVIDRSGRRFVDEGRGGVFVANAIARLDDPLGAFVVFDRGIWEGPGRNGLIPANPHLEREGGTMFKADTLVELASRTGTPGDALERLVAAHNAALSTGGLANLQPARSTSAKYAAMPISTAPYYAAPICAGITYTMGGIAIDPDGRVLREDGTPIAGLYAAGAATGGLEGGPRVGYVGGLVKCGVTGLRAAEHLAGEGAAAP